MELKQLEYFVKTADEGSLSKAAEMLYTSQPNISKVIQSLERELSCTLFHRGNKGIRLSDEGERLYQYAVTILKNAAMMKSSIRKGPSETFSVACYPSHMISRIFCEHFNAEQNENVAMHFLEGTLEDVVHHAEEYRADIGIVFFSEFQRPYINHMFSNKNLVFTKLSERPVCVYAGKYSPLFRRESVTFAELPQYRFVQSSADFFSLEQQLDGISCGIFKHDQFRVAVRTNCDNLLIDMLMHTELCNLGIHFMIPDYEQYGIRAVPVQDCGPCLTMGYVKRKAVVLSERAESYISHLEAVFGLD